jgi:hypothetical protein
MWLKSNGWHSEFYTLALYFRFFQKYFSRIFYYICFVSINGSTCCMSSFFLVIAPTEYDNIGIDDI